MVIKGYSKSAGYQPGLCFDNHRFRNTWNAVYLDGSWRFVQCNWGARHLVNAKENKNGNGRSHQHMHDANGNGTMTTNGNGTAGADGKDNALRYEYDDHYFMTDPVCERV